MKFRWWAPLLLLAVTPPALGGVLELDSCPLAREMALQGINLFDLQQKKGVEALTQAWKLCPQDLAVGFNLALARYLSGDLAGARETWDKVHKAFPDHLSTHVNLAWVNFELGDDEAAHILAFRGLDKYPGNMNLAHTKLVALFRLGRYLEAYDWLTRANLPGVRAAKWREQAVSYVVETLWRQFRRGERQQSVTHLVTLAEDYPQEEALLIAKERMVRAMVDPDAEIPYPMALPDESWEKRGGVDEEQEVLDSLVATVPPLQAWEKKESAYGLVVGIQRYRYFKGRPFADRDAANIHALLQRRGFFIPDDKHLRLRVNEAATRQTLQQDVAWLIRQGQLNPNAMLLLYFAGHLQVSGEEKDVLLVPVDAADDSGMRDQALSLGGLVRDLSALPNQEVAVILESCLNRTECAVNPGLVKEMTVGPEFFPPGKNWMIAALNQSARSYGPGRQGAFTYFLMQGLLGRGDGETGKPANGWVDLLEAFTYAKKELTAHKIDQDPWLSQYQPFRLTAAGGWE